MLENAPEFQTKENKMKNFLSKLFGKQNKNSNKYEWVSTYSRDTIKIPNIDAHEKDKYLFWNPDNRYYIFDRDKIASCVDSIQLPKYWFSKPLQEDKWVKRRSAGTSPENKEVKYLTKSNIGFDSYSFATGKEIEKSYMYDFWLDDEDFYPKEI